MIIEKLEKSIELKSREYNFLLISKEEQIKILSNEVLISKNERKKLKEKDEEIEFLQSKNQRLENLINSLNAREALSQNISRKNSKNLSNNNSCISQPSINEVNYSNLLERENKDTPVKINSSKLNNFINTNTTKQKSGLFSSSYFNQIQQQPQNKNYLSVNNYQK